MSYPKDYFVVNRVLMTCGGLWTPKNLTRPGRFCFRLFKFVVFMFSVVDFNASLWREAFVHRRDFDFLIKIFNLAVTIALASVKNIFWLLRGHKIQAVIATLEDERLHYENGPGFNPGLLASKAKTVAISVTMLYFITGQLTLGLVYVPAFAAGSRYLIQGKSIANVTAFQDLPYMSAVPFSYDTPATYLLALVYQEAALYFYSLNLIGLDTLMVNIMGVMGVHVEILQGAFRTIRERSLGKIRGPILDEDGLHNSRELEEAMMGEMMKCVGHLKTIFRVCDELEAQYSMITLGQVLSTLYILCSSLLLVSMTPLASKEFANELGYLFAMCLQVSLYCWYGNEITLKASQISQALWEGGWVETRRPYKVCMLITMARVRRPLHLTAGKFSPLTLNTFVSIVKGSYSYYTVLKNAKQ